MRPEATTRRHPGQLTKEEFRQIRTELGLSQQALADRLGVSCRQNINRIEKVTGPSRSTSAHMRLLLKVHREYRANMATAKGGRG